MLGAQDGCFVSTVMVRATAKAYGTRAGILPAMGGHAMMLDVGWERAARRIEEWLTGVLAPADGSIGATGSGDQGI